MVRGMGAWVLETFVFSCCPSMMSDDLMSAASESSCRRVVIQLLPMLSMTVVDLPPNGRFFVVFYVELPLIICATPLLQQACCRPAG
jgi:hypothetical protein